MNDVISRQAAIEYLMTNMNWYDEDGYESDDDYKRECITELINGVPSAQPELRWIPCSERLPEVGKDVMVCYDFKGHRSVLIGVLYGDEKFHGYDAEYLTPEGCKYRKAVAWMPLPEPWEGVGR